MKLSSKIFLAVYIPTIVIVITIVSILIHSNFIGELQLESDKNVQEFKTVLENIDANISEDATHYSLITYYQNHYAAKGIYFEYYEDGEFVFDSGSETFDNRDLLNVEDDMYNVIVEEHSSNHYMFISYKIGEDVLVYKTDVEILFINHQQEINIAVMLIIILSLVLIVIALAIAKFVTIPLNAMTKEMDKISNKDYNIKLKEGNDEIGVVAKKFNEMSKKIEENEKELLKYIESKQMFIDNLAHEMNTPLTSIKGYAEALEKFDLSEEKKVKYLTYIQSESDRILDMYKKLLFLSYKSNVDFEVEDVSINKVMNIIKDDLKERLDDHKSKLIIDNKCNEFKGDEIMFIMAISNLIKNALNNSDKGTNVYVNTYEKKDKLYIEVVDEGIGISKENISKILEPFYRVDKNRSRKNGGAGLGLSLVLRIMELHKGELKIESEEGKGSKFILIFNKD